MKRKLQVAIGLILSALFAYLAVKDIRWGDFFATLQQDKEWWYLLPAVLLFMGSFGFRAIRWHYLLQPVRSIRLHPLFSAIMIGYMGNNVLPVRLGEILRAYALNRETGISKSAGLASIVVERLVDTLGLLSFIVIAIASAALPERYHSGMIILAGVALGILAFLIAITFFEEQAAGILEKLYGLLPEVIGTKLSDITRSFLQGLTGLRATHNYGRILLYTGLIWGLFAGSTYFMLRAFNFDAAYGMHFWAGIVIFLIGTMGVMVPSSPGYVGTFHYAIIQGLALYSVPREAALGFAIVIHLMNYIPVTGLGLIYFIREGLRFKEVSSVSGEDLEKESREVLREEYTPEDRET